MVCAVCDGHCWDDCGAILLDVRVGTFLEEEEDYSAVDCRMAVVLDVELMH